MSGCFDICMVLPYSIAFERASIHVGWICGYITPGNQLPRYRIGSVAHLSEKSDVALGRNLYWSVAKSHQVWSFEYDVCDFLQKILSHRSEHFGKRDYHPTASATTQSSYTSHVILRQYHSQIITSPHRHASALSKPIPLATFRISAFFKNSSLARLLDCLTKTSRLILPLSSALPMASRASSQARSSATRL
jgi:hypothetical protein